MERDIDYDVKRFLETAPPEVQELSPGFRALGWGVEEIQQYLITARRVNSAALEVDDQGALLAEVDEARAKMGYGVDIDRMRKSGRHVSSVSVELTEEEKQIVREDVMALTVVEFKPVGRGSRVKHAVPNAVRSVMTLQAFRSVPRGARVLEVGANLFSAVKRGAVLGSYFGLVPILSPSDAVRWNQQFRAVRVMARARGRRALKEAQAIVADAVLADSSVMFANMKLQDVEGQFDYIVSIQSNWDIPIVEVPRAMRRLGATTYVMIFDRVPGLNFYSGKRTGGVADMGLRWEADADLDQISFFFDQDSSFGYKHSLKNVRDYQLLAGRQFRCDGRTYVFKEAPFSTRLQLALMCIDLGTREMAPEIPYSYADSGVSGMVRVTVPVRKCPVSDNEKVQFDTVDFDVDETSLCHVLQDRMIMGEKGDAFSTLRHIKANRFSIVHNGIRISVDNPVAVEQFRAFAVAVDALAVDMMAASEKDAAAVASSLATGGRVFQGPLQTAMRAVANVTVGPGTLFDTVVLRLRSLVSERIQGRVAVQRISSVKKVLSLPVVDVESVNAEKVVAKSCYCFERSEAMAMLNGDRGGLSDIEIRALEVYAKALAGRVCTACVRNKIDFEREKQDAAEEEFFDCVSVVGSSSDSGYESDKSMVVAVDKKAGELFDDSGFVRSELHVADDVSGIDTDGVQDDDAEKEVVLDLERYVGSLHAVNAPLTTMRAAVMEYASILRDQMTAADSYSREVLRIAGMSGTISQAALDHHCNSREWHSLVKVSGAGELLSVSRKGVKCSDFQRVFDYDTGKYHGVVKKGDAYYVSGQCSSVVYTSFKYKVWNQPAILRTVMSVLSENWLDGPEVVIPFVNGVAGCGKTTGVETAYRDEVTRVDQRIILSATLSSVKMVREHLFGQDRIGKQLVRTYDSLLVWGTTIDFREGVLDEMAALHPGQLFTVLAMLKLQYVRGYGDFKQMEYKSFLGKYKPQYSSLERFCDTDYMVHTHRNRVSILASNLDWYDNIDLCICSCCPHLQESDEGGITVVKIDSIGQVPAEKGVTYLTYTQEEKEKVRALLQAGGFSRDDSEKFCCTMAESQGITTERVYAVRLEPKHKPDSIYFERDRANVGRTRAKFDVKYYTVSNEFDEMCVASRDSRSELLRRRVHDNSVRFRRAVQESGGIEAYLRPFFRLKPMKYKQV